jgi:hypothetical protein
MPEVPRPHEVGIRIARGDSGLIDVEVPGFLRRFVRVTAQAVRASVEDPTSVGHGRLLGPVHESEDDDPLLVLTRQMAIDGIGVTVDATWRKTRLTDDEAEAWLQALSMALSIRAGELELAGEEDWEHLDQEDQEHLQLIQVLQVLLVEALETAVDR